MPTLECSSKGDKRYSAFYARVSVYGVIDSIENHFQLAKRFPHAPRTWRDAKGKRPTHMHVKGCDLPVEYLTMWYKLLWMKYLDSNPELVEYASKFETFTDMFRGNAINCQADVVKQYVKHGRKSILRDCQPLIKLLKQNKEESQC